MRVMKDSGVEYIGLVPSNWSILKTIYVLDMPITDGPHTTPELLDSGIPFISAEAISTGKNRFQSYERICFRGFLSNLLFEIYTKEKRYLHGKVRGNNRACGNGRNR